MKTYSIIAVARESGLVCIINDSAGQPFFAGVVDEKIEDLIASHPDFQYNRMPAMTLQKFVEGTQK